MRIFVVALLCAIIILAVCFYLKTIKTIKAFIPGIPKIIHQSAPADKSKWPEIWAKCQKKWKELFPAPKYEYKMWTDEDLDALMKNDFPEYYDMYKGYDQNIKRFDIARYFILHKYGGIYADMDYICFKNFYDLST